jgi:hypothetical protein
VPCFTRPKLSPLDARSVPHRASFYTDDLMLFVTLRELDLQVTRMVRRAVVQKSRLPRPSLSFRAKEWIFL